jgi:hypothetical protein
VRTDILSYEEWVLWLCALNEDNKEDKELVGVPQVGGEPCTCCVVLLCAMC